MKTAFQTLKFALIALLIISCSIDDTNSNNNNDFGTIQLSGADIDLVGSSLMVGNIAADAFGSTGTSSSVVLLDENTTIENGDINASDFLNGFIIVVTEFTANDNAAVDKTISMTILKNGIEYKYVCATPAISAADNTDCGVGFSVDKIAKEIVFTNTIVINVDTETILTMNGTINYN